MENIKHFVLIRAIYGEQHSLSANKRRLELTKGITVKTLAAQSCKDFEIAILVNPSDPLLQKRIDAFSEAGVKVTPLMWSSSATSSNQQAQMRAEIAVQGYHHDWSQALDLGSYNTLTTRLDDDDGLHPTVLERVQKAAEKLTDLTVLMHPIGYRVYTGRQARSRHESNQFFTLFSPEGDSTHVYSRGHRRLGNWPIVMVDEIPGWLWVRHQDTLSGCRKMDKPITKALKDMFPIDWSLVT